MSGRSFLRSHAALGFTALSLLTFLLLIWALPAATAGPTAWVSDFLRQYSLVASGDQRKAYLVTLIVVAGFSLLLLLLERRSVPVSTSYGHWPAIRAPAAMLLIGVGLFAYSFVLPGWLTAWACALAAALAVLVVMAPFVDAAHLNRGFIALIGAYLAILVVPGLLARPIVLMENDPVALSQFEQHLLLIIMPGSAIAAGQNYFAELPYSYGLLLPSIMSLVDRYLGQLTLGDDLQFVQYSQLVFSLSAVAAYLVYGRRNPFGVLVALLLAGPYWATAGLGIWHPNQTGFRSDALPVGLLILALASKVAPPRLALLLGATAGIAILGNLETAVALSVGYAVFLMLRTRKFPLALYLNCAAIGVAAIAAYLVFYAWALGRLPFARNPAALFSYLERYLGGNYGLRLFSGGEYNINYVIVPFALCMLAHAIYITVDGFRALANGPLPSRRAFRVAVAATLIVWFAYYFNAPNWWQIWTHLFLYGFLIIDLFDRRYFGFGHKLTLWTRLVRARAGVPRLIVLFLLLLYVPETSHRLNLYTRNFLFPTWLRGPHEAVLVSGVLMPKALGDALLTKAKKLAELNAASKGQLVYLTFNMAFMPALTRIYEPDPYRDLWVGVPGDAAFDRIMKDLIDRRPLAILIDAPEGPLAINGARADFQNRVRQAVGVAYRLTSTTDGWQIWQPKFAEEAK